MKKKNLTKFEIICYVVAALFAIMAVYMVVQNIAYMNQNLAAYGMTFMDLGGQAIVTLVDACAAYVAYGFLILAAGRIYHVVAAPCECVGDCECDCECEEEEILELEAPVEALEAPEETAEEAVEVVLAETPASVVAEDEEK